MLVYLCLSFEVMVVLYTSNLFGLCYIALPYLYQCGTPAAHESRSLTLI